MDDYIRVVSRLLGPLPPDGYLTSHKIYRTLVDFSLNYLFGLKAIQIRQLTFGDVVISQIGPSLALVIKSNGIITPGQYTAAYRHKFVECCPHFAMAVYLFSRFHLPDDYGVIELKDIRHNRYNLPEIKLLWGNNKMQLISYSQQHKLALNALNAAGVKAVGSNQDHKLAAASLELVPVETMVELAGFSHDYKLVRETLEPPPALVEQIFPFCHDSDSEFNHLCRNLRRLLLQDMAVIKHKYPELALTKHEFFNTPEFEEYCHQMMALPVPHYHLEHLHPPPNSILNHVQSVHHHLQQVSQDLKMFTAHQRLVCQGQVEYMERLRNHCNGLHTIIVGQIKANNNALVRYSLRRMLTLMATNVNLTTSIEAAQAMLDRVDRGAVELVQVADKMASVTTVITPVTSQMLPVETILPQEMKRNAVLNRRLLRQATTLYEMWNDFKDLERDLNQNNISISEWLKVHGSLERQFRHTRQKIIKFIEDEAARQHEDVEVIKEKLHNKMAKGLWPMTLDQLQRTLTSGKRVNLD